MFISSSYEFRTKVNPKQIGLEEKVNNYFLPQEVGLTNFIFSMS